MHGSGLALLFVGQAPGSVFDALSAPAPGVATADGAVTQAGRHQGTDRMQLTQFGLT